mmetsp:Transcript_29468/g.57809  ORF Transcript_29468/g.57809 Transcript_29468/m.57809 type:complete len:126 (+) Transcript_29468:126-503(+)
MDKMNCINIFETPTQTENANGGTLIHQCLIINYSSKELCPGNKAPEDSERGEGRRFGGGGRFFGTGELFSETFTSTAAWGCLAVDEAAEASLTDTFRLGGGGLFFCAAAPLAPLAAKATVATFNF